jgi:MoxR-like ATPase
MDIQDIPLRAFNKRIYSFALLKSRVRNIVGNQTNYLKSYLVQLPDKEIFFTHPILNNEQRRHTDNSLDKAQGILIDNSQRGTKNAKFSIGVFSTCFALISLQNLKGKYQEIEESIGARNIFDNYRRFLLTNIEAWRFSDSDLYFDIYTTPFKLLYIKQLQVQDTQRFMADINHYLIVKGLNTIIKNLSENEAARFSPDHDYSAFLSYWCVEALIAWWDRLDDIDLDKIEENRNKLEFTIKSDLISIDKNYFPNKSIVAQILYKIYNWSEYQLYRQLAFYRIGEHSLTDPVSCVYSLLIYIRIYSFSEKNKEMRKYEMNEVRKSLSTAIITELLKSELGKRLWDRHMPVFSLSGSAENVYPFVLTAISELLKIADPIDSIYDDYINNFTSALKWIEDKEVVQHHLGYVHYDDDENQNNVGSFSGWRSPTASSPHGNPECWSTALVFNSLHTMDAIAETNLNKEIIKELKGISLKQHFTRFRKRLDSGFRTTAAANDDKLYSLKKFIFYKFIQPRLLEQEEEEPRRRLENAVILHGPPGTGKTSLAIQVAECLGWNFIRLDTSILLREGLDKAAYSTSIVFEHLSYLTRTVILFDEIDECIRERSDPKTTFENRLLTNTMLTNLNDLKNNENIIFFVATNWFQNVDEAIKRPGRFDAILYIDYPQVNELINKMNEIIGEKRIKLKPELIEELEHSLRNLLDKRNLLNENKVVRDLTDSKWEEFVNYVLLFMEGVADDDDIHKAMSLFQEEFKTYFYTDQQQTRLQYDESSRINLYNFKDRISYHFQDEKFINDVLEVELKTSSKS